MRRLCFGGSFNPIHHAHLICARSVAEAAHFDRVVLIPSANPPHKADQAIAPPQHRLAMCRRAIERRGDLFEVSDIELRRPGRSYTLETVRALKESGWAEVHWLIGADMLMYLPQWHQPLALLEEVKFVVMARPGWTLDWSLLPEPYRKLEKQVVQAPRIDLSATHIRQRVGEGKSIAWLVPEAVEDYIRGNNLYRPDRAPA